VPWLSLQGSQSVHSTRGFLQKLFACKSSKRGWSNDSYNEYFQIALKIAQVKSHTNVCFFN
jgi:hypothetical protein